MLQIVSKSKTPSIVHNEEAEPQKGWRRNGVCQQERGTEEGGLGSPTSIGEENEC